MAYDIAATEAYIRQAAKARGIDPDTAVRVAKSEGLAPGVYQSKLGKGGTREPSFGPFQLLVGGEGTNYPAGMGNDFVQQTGLDPRDPSTVPQQVDFALDNAAKNGWGAWYGAAKAGIGNRDGIGGNAAPQGTSTRELNMGSATMAGYPTGGLGGLGGLGMMAEEEPQAPQGFAGYLNDPGISDVLRATFASMMSSPSNTPFAAVSDILPGLQRQRQTQQALDLDREDKQQSRAAMQMALVQSGFSPEQAAAYATSPQAASVAAGAMEERKALTQQNRTLQYLQTNEPDIAAQIEAGLPITEGLKLAQERRAAGTKLPNLEILYDEKTGREYKGYIDPVTREPVRVGGIKAPSNENGVIIGPDGTIQVGGSGGMGKPPSGFMQDPNDPSRLTPIPGGPGEQIPGELAARVGLADNFLKEVPELRKQVAEGAVTGWYDRARANYTSNSPQAAVERKLKSGVDALQRMLTGAGQNESEARNYVQRYLPTFTDDATSITDKLDQLAEELTTIKATTMRGRGGTGATEAPANPYKSKYGLD